VLRTNFAQSNRRMDQRQASWLNASGFGLKTPKAFANSSPELEHSDNPGEIPTVSFLFATQDSRYAQTLGSNWTRLRRFFNLNQYWVEPGLTSITAFTRVSSSSAGARWRAVVARAPTPKCLMPQFF
jgi:hypothetical protein